jgi:hypothetical protein
MFADKENAAAQDLDVCVQLIRHRLKHLSEFKPRVGKTGNFA